jgi:hypothetical protein
VKKMQTKTRSLLTAIVSDFDRRKSEAIAMLKFFGLDSELTYSVDLPEPIDGSICTFSKAFTQPLSAMLSERFKFASTIVRANDVWPDLNGIKLATQVKAVKLMHTAIRNHWQKSAPARYKNSELSLFGYTIDVPENLVYLAWNKDSLEPNVFVYQGQSEEIYTNLDEYLEWILERP